MLRLQPTTLSLTMTEVKEFERRRRFKNYLSKNETFVNQLPLANAPPSRIAGSADIDDAQNREPSSQLQEQQQQQDEEVSSSPALLLLLRPSEEKSPKLVSRAAVAELPKAGQDSRKGSSQSNSKSNSPCQTAESSSSAAAPLRQGPAPGAAGVRPAALPPPFSTDTRTVSDSQSLPSAEASPPSRTRARYSNAGLQQRPTTPPPRRSSLRSYHTADDVHASPPSTSGRSRIFSSAVRFVGSVIARSPPSHRGSSPYNNNHNHNHNNSSSRTRRSISASPTPRTTTNTNTTTTTTTTARRTANTPTFDGNSDDEDEDEDSTPRRQQQQQQQRLVTVYNDSVPASQQPQTPSNLPEARHQSRVRLFQGSHTAPVARVATRAAAAAAGMNTPGFRGLYGGIENSEDSTLFDDSSIFAGRD